MALPIPLRRLLLLAALAGATPGTAQERPSDPASAPTPDRGGEGFADLMRTGRYADAVRVSQLALAADLQNDRTRAATDPALQLQRLLVAASYDGQSEVAIRAARDLADREPRAAVYLPLVFARFGQWEEIIRLPVPRDGFQRGLLAYAWGLAMLRIDGPDAAVLHLTALEIDLMGIREQRERVLLTIAGAVLAAEIDADVGRYDEAIHALEEARVLEVDSLEATEPEEWIVPVRQVLGAILLDAGRAEDAERTLRDELETHPENGWSLYGLVLALRAQGKAEEAAEVLTRYDRAWARADVGLRGSRF